MASWLVTLAFIGLRCSELRGLFWEDINLERKTLAVPCRDDRWGKIGPPKTKRGYRAIVRAPIVANTLKEWRCQCPRPAQDALDLVFHGRGGGVAHHAGLQCVLEAGARHAEVVNAEGKPQYGLHSLRHFFASWGVEQGFTPKRLQELLGHGSIQMTFDGYGHLLPNIEDDDQRFAAAELALLGTRQPPARARNIKRWPPPSWWAHSRHMEREKPMRSI